MGPYLRPCCAHEVYPSFFAPHCRRLRPLWRHPRLHELPRALVDGVSAVMAAAGEALWVSCRCAQAPREPPPDPAPACVWQRYGAERAAVAAALAGGPAALASLGTQTTHAGDAERRRALLFVLDCASFVARQAECTPSATGAAAGADTGDGSSSSGSGISGGSGRDPHAWLLPHEMVRDASSAEEQPSKAPPSAADEEVTREPYLPPSHLSILPHHTSLLPPPHSR